MKSFDRILRILFSIPWVVVVNAPRCQAELDPTEFNSNNLCSKKLVECDQFYHRIKGQ